MKINEDLITTEPVSLLSTNGISVHVLRLDKIHPVISGNKWYKLKCHLAEAKEQRKSIIVTYGGAYSNHIVATAAACAAHGIKSIGIIRGEEPLKHSHTLMHAAQFGMKLIFLSREDFKSKHLPQDLINEAYYYIPEGGYSLKGAEGAATIPYDQSKFNAICCAVGTGTMIAGLIDSSQTGTRVMGFSVLKNNLSIESEIKNLLCDPSAPFFINHDYHFGGYAKHKPELLAFMNNLYEVTGIPTDFVYTGKLFYGVHQLVSNNFFEAGDSVLLIHSGGLQGNLSLRKGTLIF